MSRTLPGLLYILLLASLPLGLKAQSDSAQAKSRIVIKSQVQIGNDKKEKIIEHHFDGQHDISSFIDSILGNDHFRFNTIEILRQKLDDIPRVLDSLLEGYSEWKGLNMDYFLRRFPNPEMRPFLGIVLEETVTDDNEKSDRPGIAISRVIPGSAADEAGLRAGDILIAADDKQIENITTIQQIVSSKKVGDKIVLQFLRDGHVGSTVATLKAKNDASPSWITPVPEIEPRAEESKPKCDKIILEKPRPKLGISITDLTQEARKDLRVKKGGVLITKVEKGSVAGKMGLSINDVVTEVNGQKINAPHQLKDLINNLPMGSPLQIKYIRYGKKKSASGTLNEYAKAWD